MSVEDRRDVSKPRPLIGMGAGVGVERGTEEVEVLRRGWEKGEGTGSSTL